MEAQECPPTKGAAVSSALVLDPLRENHDDEGSNRQVSNLLHRISGSQLIQALLLWIIQRFQLYHAQLACFEQNR